jgi:hypothetical protein
MLLKSVAADKCSWLMAFMFVVQISRKLKDEIAKDPRGVPGILRSCM